ncbi:MAG: SRPBCC family protein [Candidatus Ranarchaeia archaeon]|jgi:uncharacterized membrane protein
MIKFADSIKIKAPPKKIFDFITNLENLAQTIPPNFSIQPHTQNRAAPGIKVKWTITNPDGSAVSWDEEFLKVEPDTRVEWAMVGAPEKFSGGYVLYRIHDGTLLVLWEAMAQSDDPIGHDKGMRKQLQSIKKLVESFQ